MPRFNPFSLKDETPEQLSVEDLFVVVLSVVTVATATFLVMFGACKVGIAAVEWLRGLA